MIFHHGSLDEERDFIYGGGSFHCVKHGGERGKILTDQIKEAVDQWWKAIS